MVDFVLPVDVKELIYKMGSSKAEYRGKLTMSNNCLVINSLGGFLSSGEKVHMLEGPLTILFSDSGSEFFRMRLGYRANGYVLENDPGHSCESGETYCFLNGLVVQLWSFRDELQVPHFVVLSA